MSIDLNNKKTQYVMIGVGVLFFIFMAFAIINKEKPKDTPRAYNKEKPLSQSEMLKKRIRGKEKRNVKSYSLENILTKQIKKDPFKKDTIRDTIVIKTEPEVIQKALAEKPKPKKKIKRSVPKPKPKPVPEPKPRRRRKYGFSGSRNQDQNQNQEQTNISAVASELEAVINYESKVQSGDNIILRTTKKGRIGTNVIPANTLITGTVKVGSNRVMIDIKGIKLRNRFLSKNLEVYEPDGSKGLQLSRELKYELNNDGANTVLNETSRQVKVPYVGGLLKSIGKKKINNPRVPIPKGHKIIIKELI